MSSGPQVFGGELRGKTHVLPMRVYYEDTDAGGIVYHANYLRFAERGRTEMLRAIGIHQNALREETGLIFAVYKGEVHYIKPAKLDDLVLVETALTELSGASVRIRQTIRRALDADTEDLVQFIAQVVCINADGRAARLPANLRKTLEPYVTA
ncbi:MAG: tol-pal system-associated acyl-CoA thioesterase [Rhodospirillaceae bacterium]|nr:tol-pal system-associated acyl-CoA thioesterase [Rhodospirillaceae bacterium]